MERHGDGRVAQFRCWCGAVAEWRSHRRTGRPVSARPSAASPPRRPAEAAAHFADRLRFETDCADVHADLAAAAPGIVRRSTRGSRHAYAAGHVPGARSLPHADDQARRTSPSSRPELPRATLLFVTYCWGPHCNGATRAAARARRARVPGEGDDRRRRGLARRRATASPPRVSCQTAYPGQTRRIRPGSLEPRARRPSTFSGYLPHRLVAPRAEAVGSGRRAYGPPADARRPEHALFVRASPPVMRDARRVSRSGRTRAGSASGRYSCAHVIRFQSGIGGAACGLRHERGALDQLHLVDVPPAVRETPASSARAPRASRP